LCTAYNVDPCKKKKRLPSREIELKRGRRGRDHSHFELYCIVLLYLTFTNYRENRLKTGRNCKIDQDRKERKKKNNSRGEEMIR
jgi:hypothetical protein